MNKKLVIKLINENDNTFTISSTIDDVEFYGRALLYGKIKPIEEICMDIKYSIIYQFNEEIDVVINSTITNTIDGV